MALWSSSINLHNNRPLWGVWLMAVGVFGFAMIDASAKYLLASGLISTQIVFARYLGHFIISLFLFGPQYGPRMISTKHFPLHFLRSISLMLSTLFNFKALGSLPLTLTTSIMFSAPLLIALLSSLFLGERLTARQCVMMALGFLGILITTQPYHAHFETALCYSFLALFFAACYFLLTRVLAQTDSNATCQFYGSGIALLCLIPFVGAWHWSVSLEVTTVLILIGCFGAFGHSMVTLAHAHCEASRLAPMIYTQFIYASLFSWLLFNMLPNTFSLVGTGMIIISTLAFFRHHSRRADKEADVHHEAVGRS